jgi:hypothetical protein
MKKLLLAIVTLSLAVIAHAGAFEEGFEAGFETGYKANHGQMSIVPICPIPPIPPIGEDDYNNGFKYGMWAGMRR